jgi:conjugal transfer ATP-binding protein TraC
MTQGQTSLLERIKGIFSPAKLNFISSSDADDLAVPRSGDGGHVNDSLGTLFPYSSYDSDYKLFVIDGSNPEQIEGIGFTIEINPQVGASEEMAESLAALLSTAAGGVPNIGIQVSSFGSPDLEHLFRNMRQLILQHGGALLQEAGISEEEAENRRARLETLFELNERRIAHYRQAATADLFPSFPYRMRDIRSFISVVIPSDSFDAADLRRAADVREVIRSALKNEHLYGYDWSAEDLIYFMGMILNPHRTATQQFPIAVYDEGKAIHEQIVLYDTRATEGEDEIVFQSHGDEPVLMRAMSPMKYPKRLELPNVLSLLGAANGGGTGYPCMFLVTAGVSFDDYEREKSTHTIKAARAQQNADSQIARYLPRTAQINDDYKLSQSIYDAGGRYCQTYHQLLLFAPSSEINRAEQAARSIWRGQRWELAVDTRLQKASLMAACPMTYGPLMQKDLRAFKRSSTKSIYNAANALPCLGEFRGTPPREKEREQRPVFTTFGRLGQSMTFDLFANPSGNYNAAIVGTSGSGKSAFANELVLRSLSQGDRGWIIDVGGSYKKLCEQLNGTYISFGRSARINLNPFSMFQSVVEGYALSNDPLTEEQAKAEAEDIEMFVPVFEQMVAPTRGLTDWERRQLAMHIQSVILDAKMHREGPRVATIDDLASSLINNCEKGGPNLMGRDDEWVAQVKAMTYEERQAICDPRIRELGQNLQSFGSAGLYGDWFRGTSSVNIGASQLVVLELEELNNRPDLRAVVLMLLIRMITNEMYLGSRSQGKFVLIDEAWDLMSEGNSGKFIEIGYRRARKYKGAFITATQDIGDYDKSELSKAALMNSDWLFLLRQKKESVDALQASNKFKMDAHTETLIKSLRTEGGRYSEIFIRCGDLPPAVGRLFFDPFTLLLASSKAEDVEDIEHYKARGMTVAQAVEAVLHDRGRA